jgi:CDP-diacylglycerol--glycerol-3-phosphate 3-phosphatidyltransferase
VACWFKNLGFSPNTLTIIGLLGNILAAILIYMDQLVAGGIVVMLSGSLDALDGALARNLDLSSSFGAFLDSVSDRYAEVFIFSGILGNFLVEGDHLRVLLVFTALSGSILVSYTRARAESLGADCKVGIMTRTERYIAIIIMLLANQLIIGLLVISILSHLTAIHRILETRKQLRD